MNLVGEKFGSWQVLEPLGYRSEDKEFHQKAIKLGDSFCWKCKCSCGKISSVRQKNLLKGRSKSCWDCSMKRRDSSKLNQNFLNKQTIELADRNNEVLSLLSNGYSISEVAKRFELSKASIHNIVKKQAIKSV